MGKEHWIVPLLQKKWASIFCTSTLALTAHRTSDQASIWQRTRSSFALQQLEEGRIVLKIMELQKCEGGMTGEQNETQCILTSSNCKTGFYARCLRCQLKMVILAKGSVTALYKPLGPELGNAAVIKAEWGQHGDNMQVITHCVIPHCEVFWQTLENQNNPSIKGIHSSSSFRHEVPPPALWLAPKAMTDATETISSSSIFTRLTKKICWITNKRESQ